MKYIYLMVVSLVVFASTANAQLQFQRVGGDTTHSTDAIANAYAWFKNTGSTPIRVRLERTMNHLPNAQWTSSICYGFCYLNTISVVPPPPDSAIYLPPGRQDTMDVTMETPTNGMAHIKIKVYNDANPSQFVERDFYVIRTNVGIQNISSVADKFALSQNYPNPFNPTTKINFSIPKNEFVTLKVYDILGNEVANLVNQNLTTGQYTVDFNSAEFNLSSGVFYYKLISGSFVEVKKMMLVK